MNQDQFWINKKTQKEICLIDSYKKDVELCNEQIILTTNRVTSLIKLFVMTFLNLGQWHNTKDLSWKEQFYRDI